MPAIPILPLAAALVAAATAVTACGGTAPVEATGGRVRLTLAEYRVAPQDVRVGAGRLTLVVRNAGTIVHRLQVRSEDRAATVATSPPLRPGETAEMAVKLAPGAYVVTCPQARHHTLGEHGRLVAR